MIENYCEIVVDWLLFQNSHLISWTNFLERQINNFVINLQRSSMFDVAKRTLVTGDATDNGTTSWIRPVYLLLMHAWCCLARA